jgi:hypothetical protein
MENKKNPSTSPTQPQPAASPVTAAQIKPELVVVCSQNGELGVVDHMQGADQIKLKKDKAGVHHFIPLAWVKSVDGKAHLDRPGAQAMKEWTDKAPATAPARA